MLKKILLLLFVIILVKPSYNQNLDDSLCIVGEIIITGNKKTKPQIIHRELLFEKGDTLLKSEIETIKEKSRKNLLNISLFNFASINYFTTDSAKYNFIVDVTERWYTWPNPIFEISERNFNSWWKDKDFNRINYGFFIEQQNFRGRNETLKWLMRFGYDERYAFDYKIPYINKNQTLGLGLKIGIKRNHETAYQTFENKLEHIKDTEHYLFKQYFASISINLRKKIHETHTVSFGWHQNEIGDTVIALNPNFSPNSAQKHQFLNLSYYYKNDHRDIKAYPLKGYYLDFSLQKTGLGAYRNHPIDFLYFKTSLRKYWQLSNKLFFASSLDGKISSAGKQPYHIIEALGYGRAFVRGFEYYVIDGQHFGLSKSNLKFEILPTKVMKLPVIHTEKFSKIHIAMYLNSFFDIGYVVDDYYKEHNNLTNSWLQGGGLGLDIVTYYDKVLRVEYSMNKMQETGVFLHFIAPI